jgi:hypothetical protein
MTQRLYINDELVDIAEGTKITLNYKSNIFGDISKITASNSQTIKLPKTTRNCRILDNPTAPAYNSRFRYKRHACRYEQNGVELLRGYAVLLDSSADYEIALYWGVLAKYQAWKDANPSLRDLQGSEALAWNSVTTPTTVASIKNRGYGYAYYANGASDTTLANIHPSVLCSWVLGKISEEQGVTFSFPRRVQDAINNLAMPCLSNYAGEAFWNDNRVRCTAKMNKSGSGIENAIAFLQATSITAGSQYIVEDATVSGVKQTRFDVAGADKIRVAFKDFSTGNYNNLSMFTVTTLSSTGDTIKSYSFAPTTNYANAWGFNLNEEVDATGADMVTFAVYFTDILGISTSWNAESFSYIPLVENNTYPCRFDIMPNLPDISQIDFLKALCGMFGVFAMPDTNNPDNINFAGIEELMGNRSLAYDWTNRLKAAQGGEAIETKFSIGDYAQKNWFRYAEDDTVSLDADYPITIANDSLDAEKDVIKLPFAPSRGYVIEHYEKRTEDGKTVYENTDVKPRIMYLTSNNATARLNFAGLSFKDLLGTYYKSLSAMLNNAIVLKEKLHISEYDIIGLDFTRPVYLAQYSRYFGIVSLQVSGNECTAELALLPTTINES